MPIKKIKNKDTNETITYKLKFIDTFTFMRCSSSGLVDNLSEIKDNKRLDKKLINELIKKFSNTYKFCNDDINKFIMLLRQGVYHYEYMDSWDKFNETELPTKKDFYSEKNKEHINDKDYEHAQKVFRKNYNNIGDYHDLYVQLDTLLLADVFENFRNMCLKIYDLDPSYFYSALGLAWKSCLKTSKKK